MASIRGHQGSIKFFQDGELLNVANLTNVDINQDSTFMRSRYVGQPIPEGDQSCDGWSGTMDAEVKDAAIDDLIDALVLGNLNGIGVPSFTFTATENYPDGSTRSYVYFDCQFKMAKNQKGQNDKMTKRLEFQASGRLAL